MTKLVDFTDNGKACYSIVQMSNGDPCWIGIAQTGILVKKSRLGFLGAKLYEEKNAYKAAMTAKTLSFKYPDDLTPNDMFNPVLQSITNAVLHCDNVAEVAIVLNEAFKEHEKY